MESEQTAAKVADWMLEELKQHGTLFQESAAHKIRDQFGDTFVHTNIDGNLAIGRGSS